MIVDRRTVLAGAAALAASPALAAKASAYRAWYSNAVVIDGLGGINDPYGPDKIEVSTTENGVQIVGYTNLAGRIAADSSALYARNLYNFMALMIKDGALAIPAEDQLISETRLA